MADNGKWFKLWVAALGDGDLSDLDIADFGRWAKFGAYLKSHGEEGVINISAPARVLCFMFQVSTFNDVITCVKKFPNCKIEEGKNETGEVTDVTVTWLNWSKYQGDISTERVRKFREVKRSKRRREEKREEEIRGEEINTNTRETQFEEFWKSYPERNGKKLLKKEARETFLKEIKDEEVLLVLQAARNYANSKAATDGFAKDAIRFLKKDYWREWIEPEKAQGDARANPKHSGLERKDYRTGVF